jgi:hypothetical protein
VGWVDESGKKDGEVAGGLQISVAFYLIADTSQPFTDLSGAGVFLWGASTHLFAADERVGWWPLSMDGRKTSHLYLLARL